MADLPRPTTCLVGGQIKRRWEAPALAHLVRELPSGDGFLDLGNDYDAAASPEARLVKDADKLEMVHQALRYEERGHRNLAEFWTGHAWYFRTSRELFDALHGHRPVPVVTETRI